MTMHEARMIAHIRQKGCTYRGLAEIYHAPKRIPLPPREGRMSLKEYQR